MRPAQYLINRNHPLANRLQLAWLGGDPLGARAFSSDISPVVGDLQATAYWKYSPEADRPGLVLDADSDYVYLREPLGLLAFIQNTHIFSISFWVKIASIGSGGYIASNSNTGTRKGFLLYYDANGAVNFLTTYGSGTGSQNKSADGAITAGTLTHVLLCGYRAASTNYNTVQFYINGSAVTSTRVLDRTNLASGNSTYNVFIGALNTAGSPSIFLNGEIYDFMIWDRTLGLTDARILASKDPLMGGFLRPLIQRRKIPYIFEAAAGKPAANVIWIG